MPDVTDSFSGSATVSGEFDHDKKISEAATASGSFALAEVFEVFSATAIASARMQGNIERTLATGRYRF